MSTPISPYGILSLPPAEIALRLRALAQQQDVNSLTARFLDDVHSGAVHPTVLRIWIPLAVKRSPSLLKTLLLDRLSFNVRHAGIVALKRALATDRWREDGWDAAGGTAGLVEVFQTVGLAEIKKLVRVVGGSNPFGDPGKAAAIEELVQLLMPTLLPLASPEASSLDTTKQRFLLQQLFLLIPACSTAFLSRLFSKQLPKSFENKRFFQSLARYHPNFMRRIAVRDVVVHESIRQVTLRFCLRDLIYSVEPYKPQHRSSTISATVSGRIVFFNDLVNQTEPKDILTNREMREGIVNIMKIAVRHKTPFSDILTILEAIISAAEKQTGKVSLDDFNPLQVMRFWALTSFPNVDVETELDFTKPWELRHPSNPRPEHREALYSLVIRTIKASSGDSTGRFVLYDFFTTIFKSNFPPAGRLPTIKAICRYLPGVEIDLDTPLFKVESKRLIFDLRTLDLLPSSDAKWLLQCVKAIARFEVVPTSMYGARSWSGLNSQPSLYREEPIQLWEAAHSSDDKNPLALKLIGDAKRKAERNSDAGERLNAAKYAVKVAVQCKSVKLLNDVVTWTRRFLRDPIVGPAIYEYICSDKIGNVLSCVGLPPLRRPRSLSALIPLVDQANATLSFHLETALLAMLEPSFKEDRYILDELLQHVVSKRIEAVRELSWANFGSEGDLGNILLGSMLPVLLKFETIGQSVDHKDLSWDNLAGPLGELTYSRKPRQFVLRFLDDLARQRDELWVQERIRRNPAVSMLGAGWPRGLAVHHLFPSSPDQNHYFYNQRHRSTYSRMYGIPSHAWTAAAVADEKSAPFVSKRVKDVVFCDPKVVLGSIPRNTECIGPFCDSWWFAFKAYVGDERPNEQAAKILKVFEHYSKPAWTNMDHIEAFKRGLVDFAKGKNLTMVAKVIDPIAPLSVIRIYEDSLIFTTAPTEWDPRPNGSAKSKGEAQTSIGSTNSTNQTLLQCRFHTHYTGKSSERFGLPSSWTTPNRFAEPKIWDLDINMRKLPLQTQEALVVSAILFLDSLCTGSPRLLSKRFPENVTPPRYPSLYLHDEFLSAMKQHSFHGEAIYAIKALQQLVKIVPPTLLRDLASSLLETLISLSKSSPKYAMLQKMLMDIIQLLHMCDRPQLAVDLGLEVIEQLPDASSWYRSIISLRLGKRLIADDAEQMLQKFSARIVTAIETQRKAQDVAKNADTDVVEKTDAGEAPPPKAPTAPFAKISTMKMLPQLSADNDLVSFQTSLDIFRTLFAASRHSDVRHTVVNAVLTLLQKSSDMEDRASDGAYATIVSFSTAVACPSEKDAISEDKWRIAEEGGSMPIVDNDRPLLQLFINPPPLALPERFHGAYVREVILPLLDESTRQHNRWMRIFLSRAGLTPEEASVTDFGPFGDDVIDSVLTRRWAPYLGREYLVRHRTWALSYLDCRKFKHINDKLDERQKGWRDTSEGQYWLAHLVNHQMFRGLSNIGFLLGLEFQMRPGDSTYAPKIADGITKEHLVDEYCTRVGILVRQPFAFKDTHASVSLEPFKSALGLLTRQAGTDPIDLAIRQTYARTILQRIAADIESLRSPAWLKDPNRSPVILPPPLLLQTMLLPWPDSSNATTQQYEVFVAAIDDLVKQCAASISCTSDFTHLLDAVSWLPSSDRLPYALALGDITEEEHGQLAGHLKVQLARKMLQGVKVEERNRSAGFAEMIQRWKESPSESVRLLAWELIPEAEELDVDDYSSVYASDSD